METNYKDIIRRNVCKLLKDKELTPSDAARLIGEKPTCVIRCYNGTRPFPFPILSKLANAFDMRLIDILTYPDKWIPITAIGKLPALTVIFGKINIKKVNIIKLNIIFFLKSIIIPPTYIQYILLLYIDMLKNSNEKYTHQKSLMSVFEKIIN